MNKPSPAWTRVETDGAGIDVQRLQQCVGGLLCIAEVYEGNARVQSTDIARNAYREAAAQLKDNVIPVLKCAMDDIEDEYRVSREGAVDVE